MTALAFAELERLRGRHLGPVVRSPCPVCSPSRQRRHQRLPCFTSWAKDHGNFISYACRHCGIGGYAVREGAARQRREQPQALTAGDEVDDVARQRAKARWLWGSSSSARGTIVETYLRQARGITSELRSTVRFLTPHKPGRSPAMLVPYALASEPEPGALNVEVLDVTAVHLTLLKPDGSGKAEILPNKITVGSPAGMPLVLAPMGDALGLAVTEGIEDGLSVHQATGLGAWAAGGASNLPGLVTAFQQLARRGCPPEAITLIVDGDDAGRAGSLALAAALADLSAAHSHRFEVLLSEALA